MKYKVGDVVRLKSAEELIKLGTWYKECAEECGGKSYKIEEFIENSYRGENTTFDEESIECLVSEEELPKQSKYTFDELKERVNALKDYATKMSSELNVGISIEVETEIEEMCVGIKCRSVKGSSKINIID